MARTIWFSNWNFPFSLVNGKYPKCPLYADSIFNYSYTTYTDKNKRRISDKCCQFPHILVTNLNFDGFSKELMMIWEADIWNTPHFNPIPALSVLDIGWNIASQIWHTNDSVISILSKQNFLSIYNDYRLVRVQTTFFLCLWVIFGPWYPFCNCK